MALPIEVEVIHRETIKPSSPTPPPDKNILKLSLIDQLTPITYTSLVLFYPSVGDTKTSDQLKTSLSETLTLFYPLAGRLKDNAFIICNHEGAEFIEARINCPLSDILKEPDVKLLRQFLPAAMESNEAATGCLLLVQANFFDCGGMAVGVCISHKLADAATFAAFIKCWSSTALSLAEVMSPVFMGASIFPPVDISIPMPPLELTQQNCVMKRFVFDCAKIEALRAKVANTGVPRPTRVEAVSALIWKSAIAASRSSRKSTKLSIWSLAVDLRKRLAPPLPKNFAGNCVGNIAAKMEDDEVELHDLVCRLRKEIQEFGENYAQRLQGDGALQAICEFSKAFGELVKSKDIDFYNATSWCNLELYDADFGWGKPIWLSFASTKFKNVVLFTDTRDGNGIEAWLTLSDEEMALLESNVELLEFAAVNPSIISF